MGTLLFNRGFRIAAVFFLVGVIGGAAYFQFGGQARSDSQPSPKPQEHARATFAGGCFWCMEPPFEKKEGVVEVVSGFTGGELEDPKYEAVAAGRTEHLEAVRVYYEPEKISYKKLLEIYWRQVDPTDDGGQFVDRGQQYTTGIFYHDERQEKLARESKQILNSSGIFDGRIVTEIRPAEDFYKAESYHQDYYRTHSLRYKFYRYNSGRDEYLNDRWADREDFRIFPGAAQKQVDEPDSKAGSGEYIVPDRETLKRQLTDRQYKVTQRDATEPAFENKYYDNEKPGIYVDVVSGEPLFSSRHKYESGTGWPSFYKPLVPGNIVTKPDRGYFSTSTEVRSRGADSHLGHVIDDGPEPTGKRYCINSAALQFIPVDRLEEEGYGEFVSHFEGREDQ